MKKFWNVLQKVSVVVVLAVVFLVTVAGITRDNGTLSKLIISRALNFKTASVAFFTGTSYIAMGDSAYLSVGALVADTSSFATPTGLFTKAIYVPGGTVNDVYFATRRIALGVSTGKQTTDSTRLHVMAKTDSAIVFRSDTLTSGLKFNLFHLKLR